MEEIVKVRCRVNSIFFTTQEQVQPFPDRETDIIKKIIRVETVNNCRKCDILIMKTFLQYNWKAINKFIKVYFYNFNFLLTDYTPQFG